MFRKDLWKEMKLDCIAIVLIFLTVSLQQGKSQIFPGLVGEPLVEALRDAYTPGILLNDTQVKDTLYAKIFMEGDSVRCIYSGLARYLPSGVDPSQWLYGTGLEVGSINLEHSWPQAKGAGEGRWSTRRWAVLKPIVNSCCGPYGRSRRSERTSARSVPSSRGR